MGVGIVGVQTRILLVGFAFTAVIGLDLATYLIITLNQVWKTKWIYFLVLMCLKSIEKVTWQFTSVNVEISCFNNFILPHQLNIWWKSLPSFLRSLSERSKNPKSNKCSTGKQENSLNTRLNPHKVESIQQLQLQNRSQRSNFTSRHFSVEGQASFGTVRSRWFQSYDNSINLTFRGSEHRATELRVQCCRNWVKCQVFYRVFCRVL